MPKPPRRPRFLDENLISEILSWLPAETLMELKCVCKSWNSLISDPQFAKLHLRRSYTKHADFTRIPLMFSRSHKNASSCSANSLMEQTVHYRHPLSSMYRFIGTCNGLIALLSCTVDNFLTTSRSRVRLWNPTTRSMSQKSPPLYNNNIRVDPFGFGFGFGYDYVSDTYKVVAVSKQMVKVHSIGGDCWRNIQSFPSYPGREERDGVYLNGTLNWIGVQNNSTNLFWNHYIISFDLGNEKCGQLSLPSGYEEHVPCSLVILKGCLCVLYGYHVWQMRKFGVHESWTPLLKITNIGRSFVPLCMFENDDVLLLSRSEGIFFLWNHRENFIACLKIPKTYEIYNIQTYIGSLVSPC